MSSLKELLKTRLLADVINAVQPTSGSKWKILVVDSPSKQIFDSVCKPQEILNLYVTDIVNIEDPKRQPFPDMEAIYFLSPVPESVEALIADYTNGRPPYARVHLFFSNRLSETLSERIKKSPVPRFLEAWKELYVDFLATENHCFSLDLPWSFSAAMTSPAQSLLNYELEPIANRLVSVLATLGEYPYIRYYHPPQPTSTPTLFTSSSALPLSGKIAEMVQKELDALCRVDPNYPPKSQFSNGVLMIVDRGIDPAAPLLHEFTYQAMVNDLLQPEKIMFEEKPVKLDESDKIWATHKLSHIADVLNFLGQGVKRFMESWEEKNKSASGSSSDKVEQLRDALHSLPEYQELKAKFSVHSSVCQDCMAIYNHYHLEKIATIEQNLATGETAEGKIPKLIEKDVEDIFADKSISHSDKVRLLMLFIIAQDGLAESERNRLFQEARLNRDETQAVTNLSLLGVRLSQAFNSSGSGPSSPYTLSTLRATRLKRKDGDVKFENSRYTPVVKFLLQDQAKNIVDSKIFPWVKEPPSAGYMPGDPSVVLPTERKKATWAQKGSASKNTTPQTSASALVGLSDGKVNADEYRRNGPRIVFFILGGMTLSELRSAQEVMHELKRDIIIGSTHIITPHMFIDTLKVLHRPPGLPSKSHHPYSVPPPKPVSPPPAQRSRSHHGSSRPDGAERRRDGEREKRRDGDSGRRRDDDRERRREDERRRPGGAGNGYDDDDAPPPARGASAGMGSARGRSVPPETGSVPPSSSRANWARSRDPRDAPPPADPRRDARADSASGSSRRTDRDPYLRSDSERAPPPQVSSSQRGDSRGHGLGGSSNGGGRGYPDDRDYGGRDYYGGSGGMERNGSVRGPTPQGRDYYGPSNGGGSSAASSGGRSPALSREDLAADMDKLSVASSSGGGGAGGEKEKKWRIFGKKK
ncbi:Sec1-like protein [Zopfochytrium polystomum]|nr:Sec1-like protein [Zopfochytrium polystomum]